MNRTRALLLVLLLLAVLTPVMSGQVRELTWWSIPYGDQTTCGGSDFGTQTHFYEWRGERPERIYIYITGPTSYKADSTPVPHYNVVEVFPAVWEWEVQTEAPGDEHCTKQTPQHCWIRGTLKDSMWVDEDAHSVPIGYNMTVHPLYPDVYSANHFMAGWYPPETETWRLNAGRGLYDATGCPVPVEVYLPTILK